MSAPDVRSFMPGLRTFVAAVALAAAPVLAGIEPLADGLRRCSLEIKEQTRLACFDALVSALPKLQSDQFGMTADIARRRDPVALSKKDDESLAGKIVALEESPRGQYVFTLDNGQIWMQTEPRSSIRFAVGEPVHIEYGAMRSLWLAAERHRKTQVKRVK